MTVPIFSKTLRDQRWALVLWSLGIGALLLVMAALWPTVRDLIDADLLAALPEALVELFDIDDMVTGVGFLNTEVFSILMPGLFIAYGVGRGAHAIAGEEQDGTLEVVLVSRLSRSRIALEKAAALAVSLTVLGAVGFAFTLLASSLADMGIPASYAANGALAMMLIGLQHGALAFAVGAASGRRGLAVGVAATVAVMGYVLHVAGVLVDGLEAWQPLSPFTQAIAAGPLSDTVPLGFAWLALAAVVFVVAALPRFTRRDAAAS